MAEELKIEYIDKQSAYVSLLPQIKTLVDFERDTIANLANITAALKQTFNFLWVGFYMIKEDELVLGPFQGQIACTRIQYGKGVCGASWAKRETIIVDDVEQFPGHIYCSSDSKSEIVVPLIKNDTVIGVLDIDSDEIATFDDVDRSYLNLLCEWLVTVI